MTTVYVFPGQGSQSIGMGINLFSRYPEYSSAASNILGYSIEELCTKDSNQQLNHTDFTQPALYTVNALSYLAKVEDSGITPDYVAGHSLGEYTALFAAEVFDFITGLKLVQKRGEIMAKAQGGGMAAIIGMEPSKIKDLLVSTGFDTIDIANFNSPSQTVISGLKQDITDVQEIFENAGVQMFVPLKVSGAFHSRYMKKAQDEFSEFLKTVLFKPPRITCIANYTAFAYTAEKTTEYLAQQISNSVRWVETIQLLKQKSDPVFEEVGPGKVLSKLITQIN